MHPLMWILKGRGNMEKGDVEHRENFNMIPITHLRVF
jgi:hypothetical protein